MPVGRRVAYWRSRRNLSQQQFADMVGRSKSWVDKVERGVRRLDRVSVLHEIAAALRLDVASFVDPVEADRGERAAPVGPSVVELRSALARYDTGVRSAADPRPVPPPARLRQAVDHGWLSLQHAAYDRLVRMLPGLLVDAQRARADRRDEATAGLLGEAYQITASTLRKLGELPMAWLAADRALSVSAAAGCPVLAARAAVPLGGVVRDLGHARQAIGTCLDHAHRLAPAAPMAASPGRLSVYGTLLLQAAMGAAQTGDAPTVRGLLGRADQVATRVGACRNDHWTGFGPALVGVVRVAAAVETGEPDRALADHARVVDHPGYAHLPLAVRADHQVDTARAYVLLGDVVAAGRALLAADRTAPAEVRSRPAAREVVALVLRRSVRPDPRLVDLGRACGVDGAR